MSQQAQDLFVCKDPAGFGCGHVGPRNTWTNAFGDGDVQMCPICHKDHAFPVDLENVHRLADWGMDPEPVRALLKIEQAKEIDEMHDAIDRTQRGSMPAAALRGARPFIVGQISKDENLPR